MNDEMPKEICGNKEALEAIEKIEDTYISAMRHLSFTEGFKNINKVSPLFNTIRKALGGEVSDDKR